MSCFLAHANTDIKDETTGFVLFGSAVARSPYWSGRSRRSSPAAEDQRGHDAANPVTNCYTAKDGEIHPVGSA